MSQIEDKYREEYFKYYNQRKLLNQEGQGGSRYAQEKEHRHPQSSNTWRWAMARDNSNEFIQFWVNPSEVQWDVGIRSATQKTSRGAVHFETQRIGKERISRLELPTIRITFQSGLILHEGYKNLDRPANEAQPIPHGLANFFDFLNLLDQPNTTLDGKPNFINIFYVSPMFSRGSYSVNKSRKIGIWLQGFFTEEGVTWADRADNPNMINSWSASFMVFKSNPDLNTLRKRYG